MIDGKVILQSPTVAILQGNYFRVPLIIGYVPLWFLESHLKSRRATSNETVGGGGTDIAASLKAGFPLLDDEDIA